jgi:hypothetical protein
MIRKITIEIFTTPPRNIRGIQVQAEQNEDARRGVGLDLQKRELKNYQTLL